MWASEALDKFIGEMDAGALVLEIGPGKGEHTAKMRAAGLRVCTVGPGATTGGLWPDVYHGITRRRYDAVWCSHVLEHSPVPGHFLEACYHALMHEGILAVTVPPAKHEMVGGHLTLWTPGLLVYHCVLAGFDCSDAWVSLYGYNVSLMVRKVRAELPELAHDAGDIERLAAFFPVDVRQGCDGWGVRNA